MTATLTSATSRGICWEFERDQLQADGIDLVGLEQNGAGAKRRKIGVGLQDVDDDVDGAMQGMNGGKRGIGDLGEVAGLVVADEHGNAGEFSVGALRGKAEGLLSLGEGGRGGAGE